MSVPIVLDQTLVINGLSALYVSQELTDLRIVCTDGSLMAHKLVLSSVSDTFRQILVNNTSVESNCMYVLMVDNSLEDMKTIVDIIYFGRQLVSDNRKNQLIQIADRFGLKLKANSEPQEPEPMVWPQKPAHQKSLLLSDKKHLLKKQSILQLDRIFGHSMKDKPLDLSTNGSEVMEDNDPIEDNVWKTIESIATNGPQIEKNRRRKQLDPKPCNGQKMVRFEDSIDCLTSLTEEPYDTFGTQFASQCLTFGQLKDNSTDISIDLMSDSPKTEFTSNDNSLEESLSQTKGNKSGAKSGRTEGQQLPTDCAVCGIELSSHKQLIAHLNVNHKHNDVFKCKICGKEQKYAKSFVQHFIQCKTKAKNVKQN